MKSKNRRQRALYEALLSLGGRANTRDIAGRAGLNVNGASQTLGVMRGVCCAESLRGGDTIWQLAGTTGADDQARMM